MSDTPQVKALYDDSKDGNDQANEEANKFRMAMMQQYKPQAGRADRSATNIPGAMSIGSAKGTNR